MQFFLDTANIEEIRKANSLGVLDGVTTNPTLIAKEGKPFRDVISEICNIVEGPVSAEAISQDTQGIVNEGRDLAEIADNVVVKIPVTIEGLKAVKILSSEGIKINVTLCFTALQALLAAKAGASYISPFVGRLDDRSQDGMSMVSDIKTIYENYGFETEIIVASIRHPLHVLSAALIGADIATVPYSVFEQIVKHPLTDLGIESFLKDWQKIPKSST